MSLSEYIETVMHQLALGIAESNFDLATKYLTALPGKSGVSSAKFRRAMQALIGATGTRSTLERVP